MIIPYIADDVREIPSSVLADIGDAVYELYVRSHVVSRLGGQSGKIHKRVIEYVKAPSQARAVRTLMDELSEEEQGVFRRGKNSHQGSMAKNASPADYKYATGLEALIGYLYITDQEIRLEEVMTRIFVILESTPEVKENH